MLNRPYLLIGLLFLTIVSWADPIPQVLFVGGYGSTEEQMQRWEKAARENPAYRGQFNFRAIPLPANRWDAYAVLAQGRSKIEEIVRQIDASPPGSVFILAGHSSGAAITNEIARRVRDKSKIRLVALDGFVPHQIQSQVQTTCWSAIDVRTRLEANNRGSMRNCQNYREMAANGCNNSWCLHFVLVNSSAGRVGVTHENFKARGYDDVSPNLMWLNEFLPARSGPAPSATR
ncbi:MAG: alpha/beta hydrolase [Bdellovibrionales bacterium]|nr:alpha/beta hydrolase [Bdellovibrionales bacterium]